MLQEMPVLVQNRKILPYMGVIDIKGRLDEIVERSNKPGLDACFRQRIGFPRITVRTRKIESMPDCLGEAPMLGRKGIDEVVGKIEDIARCVRRSLKFGAIRLSRLDEEL